MTATPKSIPPDNVAGNLEVSTDNIIWELIKATLTTATLISLVGLILIWKPEFNGAILWKPLEQSNIFALLSTLLFISLALQSTLEVFVSNLRSIKKAKLPEGSPQLVKYRSETKKIINFIGLLAGVIISIAGVRIIQPFTDELLISGWQEQLFHITDILLTAGILAGGSDGIHQITSIYKSYTGTVAESVERSRTAQS